MLEIGSGTGQHAVHFAQHLTHLQWQPSDLSVNLPGMRLWFDDAQLANILAPMVLDVTRTPWFDHAAESRANPQFDGIFTANSLHIMGAPEVECFFTGLETCAADTTDLCLYGPFNYGGRYTSDSNARFDQWLAERDIKSAIRDFEWIDELANCAGFKLVLDHAMPANNRLLHYRRTA